MDVVEPTIILAVDPAAAAPIEQPIEEQPAEIVESPVVQKSASVDLPTKPKEAVQNEVIFCSTHHKVFFAKLRKLLIYDW